MTIFLPVCELSDLLAQAEMLIAYRAANPSGAVAHSLGYEAESAFSTAFKCLVGAAPADARATAATSEKHRANSLQQQIRRARDNGAMRPQNG